MYLRNKKSPSSQVGGHFLSPQLGTTKNNCGKLQGIRPNWSNKKYSKKAMDLPFSWIFAIVAGSFIIIISIYATTRFIGVTKNYEYSYTAQTIANILNPAVNGLASATAYPPIEFKKETRVYIDCDVTHYLSPVFGRQTIAFSEESGLIKKWTAPQNNISRYNKYIFSEKMMQGKSYYIFSKPFFVGYKVDDLVYMIVSSNNYCFVSAPEQIQYEMNNFAFSNINLSSSIDFCPKNSIITCFDFRDSKCNININYADSENFEAGQVSKDGKSVNYNGLALLYAAIFSSQSNYECNIARLGTKINLLGKIYKDKIDLVKTKDCGSLLEPYINGLIGDSQSLTSSKLNELDNWADMMNDKNCDSNCPIYQCEASAY